MYTDTPIHLIKTGIEYFLIIILLLGINSLVSLRNAQANAYNGQKEYQARINNQLEFGQYNKVSELEDRSEGLLGYHVIETIRKYKEGSVRVYVDKDKNNNSIYMDEAAMTFNPYEFSVAHLTQIIDPETYYHPYLIYDSDRMDDKNSLGIEVTGISFFQYVP